MNECVDIFREPALSQEQEVFLRPAEQAGQEGFFLRVRQETCDKNTVFKCVHGLLGLQEPLLQGLPCPSILAERRDEHGERKEGGGHFFAQRLIRFGPLDGPDKRKEHGPLLEIE